MNEDTDSTKASCHESVDDENTAKIIALISKLGGYELPDERHHRENVFTKLGELVCEFTNNIKVKRNISGESRGKLLPFGSYLLDVCGKGADIDTLCIAPGYITRADFFYEFGEMIKNQPFVTDFLAIPRAFVPVIKLKYEGIEVDILFAQLLSFDSIPNELDLKPDEILRDLNVQCVRSLNGCRNTNEILNSIEDPNVFRIVLRGIKVWAKRRGVYSNMLGYLGGFSCAMLVAKAAQMSPNADVPKLIRQFFKIFSNWHWPDPVVLRPKIAPKDMNFVVWNPNLYPHDRLHLMPIITPAYPQQNSTHNVTQSSFKVMKEEFKRGAEITDRIFHLNEDWSKLFELPRFFSSYTRYCVLTATAETEESFKKWTGLVVSKLRLFVGNLDKHPDLDVAHINDQTYKTTVETSDGRIIYTQYWFIGIKYEATRILLNMFNTEQQNFTNMVKEQGAVAKIFNQRTTLTSCLIAPTELHKYLRPDQMVPLTDQKENPHSDDRNMDNGFHSSNDSMEESHQQQQHSHIINSQQNGMGDSPSADRYSKNSKLDHSYVSGLKRKSPQLVTAVNTASSGATADSNNPTGVITEPPVKSRMLKKNSKEFLEPPPPGTMEPLPPGTEPSLAEMRIIPEENERLTPMQVQSSPAQSSSDGSYFDVDGVVRTPVQFFKSRSGCSSRNSGELADDSSSVMMVDDEEEEVEFTSPIPVIETRKQLHHSVVTPSPIPTLLTNNRCWTRDSQTNGRPISVISSPPPPPIVAESETFYNSTVINNSPSTTSHQNNNHTRYRSPSRQKQQRASRKLLERDDNFNSRSSSPSATSSSACSSFNLDNPNPPPPPPSSSSRRHHHRSSSSSASYRPPQRRVTCLSRCDEEMDTNHHHHGSSRDFRRSPKNQRHRSKHSSSSSSSSSSQFRRHHYHQSNRRDSSISRRDYQSSEELLLRSSTSSYRDHVTPDNSPPPTDYVMIDTRRKVRRKKRSSTSSSSPSTYSNFIRTCNSL